MEWLRMRGRFTSGKSQGFIVLLAGLLVSLFAGILVTSTPTLAADANWEGSSLEYQGVTFEPINDSTLIDDLNLGGSARVYSAPTQSGSNSELRVISFPAGSDMSSVTSAEYMVYDFVPPDDYNLISTATITTEAAGDNYGGLEQGSSCTISGIGYLVCPIANHLASGMDWIYGVLTQFLSAQPLNISDNTSGLYQAWRIMLTIANAAFIIVFMIIIYSHVTSIGVSNYGIKKLLPRLIVAAILVNVSYYVCAIAIDLSNVIGQSIQDMFISIRNTMTTIGSVGGEEIPTWETVTAAVLSGGAITTGIIVYGGSTGAASIMLVPILVGLLITIMVVLLVLAARQALIVILTIISPLAFVCYLLPGTEKWFDKWKDLFITMLIFFPAFSAVFGGSQLAGAAIIQNADSIVMLILGLAVQVAPLALAPLILKLSGGLLNRFAGIVNNPTKGVLDKSKQWAEKRSKVMAADSRRKLEEFEKNREDKIVNGRRRGRKWHDTINPHGLARRIARTADNRSRMLDDRVSDSEKALENSYHQWDKYKKQDLISRDTGREAERISNQAEADYGIARAGQLTPEMQAMKKKTFGLRRDKGMERVFENMQSLENEVAVEGLRKASAQRVLEKKLADSLNDSNNDLKHRAGHPEDILFGGNRGSQRIVAQALSTVSSANEEAIKNAETIINHSNLGDLELVEMAKGISQRGIAVTDDIRTASVRKIAGGKNAFALNKLLNEIDFSSMHRDFQQEMGEALLSNGSKPPWVGGVVSAQIKEGNMTGVGEAMVKNAMTAAINNGKLSAEVLVTTDAAFLNDLSSAMNNSAFRSTLDPAAITKLRNEIHEMRTEAIYSGRIGERDRPIEEILRLLP